MKKVILIFGALFVGFFAYLYFTIVEKESEKKSEQTAAARAARWKKKPDEKPEDKNIEPQNSFENEEQT